MYTPIYMCTSVRLCVYARARGVSVLWVFRVILRMSCVAYPFTRAAQGYDRTAANLFRLCRTRHEKVSGDVIETCACHF